MKSQYTSHKHRVWVKGVQWPSFKVKCEGHTHVAELYEKSLSEAYFFFLWSNLVHTSLTDSLRSKGGQWHWMMYLCKGQGRIGSCIIFRSIYILSTWPYFAHLQSFWLIVCSDFIVWTKSMLADLSKISFSLFQKETF